MNRQIIVAITVAMIIPFIILFTMHFVSLDPRTIQNIEKHPFFLSKLDNNKESIFLIGHSHVGQLNTTKINQEISKEFDDVDVYNLAMYHDTPSSRLEHIDKIIELHPKIVFYGIAIADFLGPCKYSNDCYSKKNNEQKLPDPKDFFESLEIEKKLGIDQMNPKFTTLKLIRERFDDNSLFSEQGRRLELGNTPFYVIDDTYTRITSDSALKKSIKESSVNMIRDHTIIDSEETQYLKEIIKKLKENNIEIVLFKTPHHKYYIQNVPESALRDYDTLLNEISDQFNIHVYDFFNKYANLPIWNDLEHVAFNENSSIYSEDIAKTILLEIRDNDI